MFTFKCLLLFFVMLPHSPASTLFPYTTLFRSGELRGVRPGTGVLHPVRDAGPRREGPADVHRSEEHTSELQSHSEVVCRLLLEKKNTGLGFKIIFEDGRTEVVLSFRTERYAGQ